MEPKTMHVDVEVLQELKEVMEDEFETLVNTFLSDSTQRIAALQSALADGNLDELMKSAHSFKGSCGNMGAPYLAELCRQLEENSRSGISDGSDQLISQIIETFSHVKDLLENFLTSE